MSERRVDPEWLDELPAADPRAAGSRADLRRLNRIMGHAPILARLWRQAAMAWTPSPQTNPRPLRVAEFGAGDGSLCLRLIQQLPPHLRPGHVTLVDRQNLVANPTRQAFARLGVEIQIEEADVFAWIQRGPRFDFGFANLFLHHFEPDALQALLRGIASATRAFAAVEPRRSPLAAAASRALALIGCNDVTRHDAVVSVRAGFAGRELSSLWPTRHHSGEPWTLLERRAGLFSHGFLAVTDGGTPKANSHANAQASPTSTSPSTSTSRSK